jgi:hypothetical protein
MFQNQTKTLVRVLFVSSFAIALFRPSTIVAAPKAAPIVQTDLSFGAAFPKPFYQKRYFPLVAVGATAVVGGVVSYFTAGAGAPSAASGVASVATFVGGGGAGSYMAGLATVGSWVGGNAMVGAAILNGASIGLGGSIAAESALSKALVFTSVSATALDGVLYFQPRKTASLSVRVNLEIPEALASGSVKDLVTAYKENRKQRLEAYRKDPDTYLDFMDARDKEFNQSVDDAAHDMLNDRRIDIGNVVVLSVLLHNVGYHDGFVPAAQLFAKISPRNLSKQGYFSYLKSVFAIEDNNMADADVYARRAIAQEPHVIEPLILRVNILANPNFRLNRKLISDIAQKAEKDFDPDKYSTPYGLATLDYRIASINLVTRNYKAATYWFEKAESDLSVMERYWPGGEFRKLIQAGLGISQCRGRMPDIEDGKAGGDADRCRS